MIQQQFDFFAAWMQTKFGVDLYGDSKEGQGLVEYALILVFVSILSIAALTTLSNKINSVFATITGAL